MSSNSSPSLVSALIIPHSILPAKVKKVIPSTDRVHFEIESEWSEDWSDLSIESIKSYKYDQGFEGTLNQFISAYGLEVEQWLAEHCDIELRTADLVMIRMME